VSIDADQQRALAIKRLNQGTYELHCASGYLRNVPGTGQGTTCPEYYACNRLIRRAEELLEELEERPRK
jgi:hypothetical protein